MVLDKDLDDCNDENDSFINKAILLFNHSFLHRDLIIQSFNSFKITIKMKQHILPAVRLTVLCIVMFCGLYSLLILGIAQVAPNKGEGEKIIVNATVKGYALEGQSFTKDQYFNGRPSAAGYNAAGSSGSNKGPSNPDYLQVVKDRIDTFLVHNPTVAKADIPSDLVTASGSGLDPNISVKGALVQVDRIAKERNIAPEKIKALVEQSIEKPLAGLFGTEKINVLALNIKLDNLK